MPMKTNVHGNMTCKNIRQIEYYTVEHLKRRLFVIFWFSSPSIGSLHIYSPSHMLPLANSYKDVLVSHPKHLQHYLLID
jgi:hypothetical protein